MVHPTWVFAILLPGGLVLARLPHHPSSKKEEKDSNANQ